MEFPSVTVIMYHYVRDLKNSKYPQIKGLDSRLFINQLNFIRRNFNVIRIEDLIETIEHGKVLKEKAALLTFDDGYADHYEYVFPALRDLGFQGSFYVPAKAVKEHEILDVNKIHFILAAVSDSRKIIDDIKALLQKYREAEHLETFEQYYERLAISNRFDSAEIIFIKRILQVELPEHVRSEIVSLLFAKYVNESESEFAKSLYLTEEQIQEMIKSGMHIGCHGYNHYWWNRLDINSLENEIDLSLNFMNELGVDTAYWTAAYPYGSHSETVETILNKKGCKMAFTTEVGIATVAASEKLKMKRFDTNDFPK